MARPRADLIIVKQNACYNYGSRGRYRQAVKNFTFNNSYLDIESCQTQRPTKNKEKCRHQTPFAII
ncbi:MAG: hypothetical protein A4E66_01428 [Syntrophus sp. PtaB.Bin001]|nr:MAG: hypothetical protein A4E66_01428 [Syntrophus sp. PtaB.Bin001]